MRSPAELTETFRRRGLKITPQRQAVFRALYGNASHPNAEAVYLVVRQEMPAISLRTVYQTLNDLAEMGEIQSIDLGTGSVRFDPNTSDHHHLVCDGCGAVRDVALGPIDAAVPADQLDGFTVQATEVTFRGRCPACAAATPTPPTTSTHTTPLPRGARHV